MALPSMEKILRDSFNMDVVTPRATSRLNGRTIEIDVRAYDNGSRNKLYIVEVKSHLTREGIDQILKTTANEKSLARNDFVTVPPFRRIAVIKSLTPLAPICILSLAVPSRCPRGNAPMQNNQTPP
jgi:hypothetical protein